MIKSELTQIMQAIAAVSKKVNSVSHNLSSYMVTQSKKSQESAVDAQEALIDFNLELDSRLADIEDALCELTEEGE